MTPEQYHSKFFPRDAIHRQLAIRTYACARQDTVFGCPKRPSASSLEELNIATIKIRCAHLALAYHVLLGRDNSNTWHEIAICNDIDLLLIWRDINYASVVAKV